MLKHMNAHIFVLYMVPRVRRTLQTLHGSFLIVLGLLKILVKIDSLNLEVRFDNGFLPKDKIKHGFRSSTYFCNLLPAFL